MMGHYFGLLAVEYRESVKANPTYLKIIESIHIKK